MTRAFVLPCAVLGVAALALVGRAWTPATARADSRPDPFISGDFVVRCPMTGEVQAIDPIMNPGGTAPHVHMFFGNPDGTDGVRPTTTFADLNSAPNTRLTTCQDPSDTAAYWAPESFLKTTPDGTAAPYLPGCTLKTDGSGNYHCGTSPSSTISVLVYYLTTPGAGTDAELPPGLIMVAGTPNATAPPANDDVIEWDCGSAAQSSSIGTQGSVSPVQSPESIWPYDCRPYEHDPNLRSQGLVEVINFPSCFDGDRSYPSPNGDGPGGEARVPGYFDPSLGGMSAHNDLSYAHIGLSAPCGTDEVVPKLSMRIHYVNLWVVSDDGNTIYPSSCAQANGLAEKCETQKQMYGTTRAPADIGLELSSSQTHGLPGPWYTEHADYWQTWQQGKTLGADPYTGELNSLSYYCLVEDNLCKFMPNTTDPSEPPYPPPPGQ